MEVDRDFKSFTNNINTLRDHQASLAISTAITVIVIVVATVLRVDQVISTVIITNTVRFWTPLLCRQLTSPLIGRTYHHARVSAPISQPSASGITTQLLCILKKRDVPFILL